MKTRQGFVSNSSSSSFVLIVTKEEYDRRLDEVHPYVRAVVEAMRDKKTDTFMGQEVVLLGTWSDAGGGSNFEDLDVNYNGETPKSQWDEQMQPYEAFHEHFTNFADDKCTFMGLSDG